MSVVRTLCKAWVRRRLATGLDGLWVHGLEGVRRTLEAGPVVFAATHVAWWDGLLLPPIDDAVGGGSRAWMEATNLARLPFLAALGAVPVHPGEPTRLRADVRAACAWLSGPHRSLWVFPQGRQRPSWWRPLDLAPGAAAVARMAGAALVPVALAYVFREVHVPAALVHVGTPVTEEGLDAALVDGLARIDDHVRSGVPAFELLVPSRVRRPDAGWPSRLLAGVFRG